MPSIYRHTSIADEAALIEFLIRVFSADPAADFVSPSLLRWKYWDPREDYSEPRSFVMERDGKIVAHAGLWPVTVSAGPHVERGVSMIDWASAPEAPGAGMAILQRLMRSFDFVYSIGGTEMTTSIMPKVGFREIAEAKTWARPLRPVRQMIEHQNKDVRLPARLVRNFVWSRLPMKAPQPGWRAQEAGPGDVGNMTIAERGEQFFRFIERCPTVQCRLFQMLKDGRQEGFFALALRRKQARIAGIWLKEPSPDHWRIAFQLAQEAALLQTGACEIIARGIAADAAAGAAAAGMRIRERVPVLFYRKDRKTESWPLRFQLADNDSFFLGNRPSGFLT